MDCISTIMDIMKKLMTFILIVLSAVILLSIFLSNNNSRTAKPVSTSQISGSLFSLQTGPYPWSTEPETLRERLKATGLPALSEEGSILHTHQHLDIFIEGKVIPIPQDIGEGKDFISPIHTHDETGVIHVESPTVQVFTLGQFFNVWGVGFDNQCLGGYCNLDDKKLQVYTNGQVVNGNYQDIVLRPREEIAIIYGTASQSAVPIPSSYLFPSGE